MKKIILIASALMISAVAVQAQDVKPGDVALSIAQPQAYIEVTGTATTKLTPNKIEVAINLNEADSKGKTSLASLEQSLAKALNDAGVDTEKQLVVTDQSSSSAKRKSIYQYKSYRLTLTNASEVATVFSLLDANGIANANVIKTDHTDIKSIEQKTKAEAMQNAKSTAEALTAAIGQKIGKAIYIQDYSVSNYPVYRTQMMSKSVMADSATGGLGDVEFQDIEVNQRVTVRFVLQ